METLDKERLAELFQLSPLFEVGDAHHPYIEDAVRTILTNIGEDPSRKGLLKTPNRVARMYDDLTSGYYTDPEKLINGALFTVDYAAVMEGVHKCMVICGVKKNGSSMTPNAMGAAFKTNPETRSEFMNIING